MLSALTEPPGLITGGITGGASVPDLRQDAARSVQNIVTHKKLKSCTESFMMNCLNSD